MNTAFAPHMCAQIDLLATGSGGRMSPIRSGPAHSVAGVGGQYFAFRFHVPPGDGLAPGASGSFDLQLLVPEIALRFFPIGTRFTLWEGRTIGSGLVLKLLRD